jgi:hypothetical protein
MGSSLEENDPGANSLRLVAELSIHDLPKLINQIGRKHWAVKHKERRKWAMLIQHECLKAGIKNLGLNSAALTFTRHSVKQCDFDSLVNSFKGIQDELVEANVIVDDSEKIIGQPKYFWKQRLAKMGGLVTIKIETAC